MGDTLDTLATRLVHAALDALAYTPANGLSLRRIAQDLGVSHQAPYVHFGSKRRFLAAVAGTGCTRLPRRPPQPWPRQGRTLSIGCTP